ncbi:MAG: 50S ribosomal protein L30 [Sphaerochaetaceae bacterium]|jgi:large subunit ribosomal protein L30
MAKAKAQEKKIRVTLVRSVIGTLPNQRRTVKALGLGKIGSSVEHIENSALSGMVRTVSHLVKVEEI